MIELTIRPAKEDDQPTIKKMIRRERLDPTSTKWQNFLIAEHEGKIVGIGQIKRFPGCNELGSLITNPRYRGQRIASRLIAELEKIAGYPLYLFCHSSMGAYYQRFGYEEISRWEAPRFLKIKGFISLIPRLFGVRVLIMRKDAPQVIK